MGVRRGGITRGFGEGDVGIGRGVGFGGSKGEEIGLMGGVQVVLCRTRQEAGKINSLSKAHLFSP